MLARLEHDNTEVTEQVAVDSNLFAADAAGEPNTDSVLGVAVETDTSFWADASCNDGGGGLAGLFFSDELLDIAAAKRICAECPVLEECLEGALARKEPWGVWGGQLFSNGKILTAKRRRGRPPKHARPEDEFVVVEVPASLTDLVARRSA